MPEQSLPRGMEPRYLDRRQAAAYLGVSTTVFDEEVKAGLWPPPHRRGSKGGRHTWDRKLLDRFADQHACGQVPVAPAASVRQLPGLLPDEAAQNPAEAAAMRGVTNAASRHRPKHRHQKAA